MTRSPLHEFNEDLGARFVDFGGWEMPVQYSSVLEEHGAVREGSGFFDVSHLGRFSLAGAGARTALDRLLCNNLERIEPGKAQYTMMLNKSGGVIDDIILWWWGDDEFWVMPNAANQPRVMAAFSGERGCVVEDLQMKTAMIAVQGPTYADILDDVLGGVPGRFRVARIEWRNSQLSVAGTGYTGEKGVEIVAEPGVGAELAAELANRGVRPCGLGARDTLRLEAGFPLWGQDLDETRTPLQADLGFAVDFDHEFVGREVLEAEKRDGLSTKLSGFILEDRGIARHGHPVTAGSSSGEVTSGNMSPVLQTGIGLAYMSPPVDEGSAMSVEVRGRDLSGHIKRPPFHK